MKGESKKNYCVDQVIELTEDGEKTRNIVRMLNVPESSVKNIRKDKDKIKETLKLADVFWGWFQWSQRMCTDVAKKMKVLVAIEHFFEVAGQKVTGTRSCGRPPDSRTGQTLLCSSVQEEVYGIPNHLLLPVTGLIGSKKAIWG